MKLDKGSLLGMGGVSYREVLETFRAAHDGSDGDPEARAEWAVASGLYKKYRYITAEMTEAYMAQYGFQFAGVFSLSGGGDSRESGWVERPLALDDRSRVLVYAHPCGFLATLLAEPAYRSYLTVRNGGTVRVPEGAPEPREDAGLPGEKRALCIKSMGCHFLLGGREDELVLPLHFARAVFGAQTYRKAGADHTSCSVYAGLDRIGTLLRAFAPLALYPWPAGAMEGDIWLERCFSDFREELEEDDAADSAGARLLARSGRYRDADGDEEFLRMTARHIRATARRLAQLPRWVKEMTGADSCPVAPGASPYLLFNADRIVLDP